MSDWYLAGTEPYTRRDGSATELWLWRRPCKHCGAMFTVKAPEMRLDSGGFLAAHCAACKDPKRVARGKAGAAAYLQKTANRRETARTTAAPNAERARNRVHLCTFAAPRCTTVQGQSAHLHHESRGPLTGGPVVVQRCGARCGAADDEHARNNAKGAHEKFCGPEPEAAGFRRRPPGRPRSRRGIGWRGAPPRPRREPGCRRRAGDAAMPRLSSDQWAAVRMEWEGEPTATFTALAPKHGVNKSEISRRATKEGWSKRGVLADINEAAQRIADARVDADGNPTQRKPNAVDLASRTRSEDVRAAVLERHRREWPELEQSRQDALRDTLRVIWAARTQSGVEAKRGADAAARLRADCREQWQRGNRGEHGDWR